MPDLNSDRTHNWRDVAKKHGLEPWKRGGHGAPIAPGKRPALVVIDTTYMYMDSAGTLSIGPSVVNIVAPLADTIAAAREKRIPIIFTKAGLRGSVAEKGLWGEKVASASTASPDEDQIIDELAPLSDNEIVLDKPKASAFFDTPLRSILSYLDVDNVVVAGVTTSGCVRATVVDAFSHNIRPSVLEDCTADRRELIHSVSLFDLEMKYAQLTNSAQFIDSLP